ncbi:MAG: serine/threonine protein kinase [Myxococcota bacterium]|jgi:serine/threonine protein kinase
MGSVYHAELRAPHGFRRACAVKVMKPVGGEHAHLVERMRDEARLLGLLHDEQILGVSELLRVNGQDAVVMEFVEGADLSELRAIAPMPPRALAELGAELAGTLYRAHTAMHPSTGEHLHVIHRDVKPANIMITSRGGVRLLDFGVARAVFGGREAQTRGLVLGTFNYFPPEIILGADPTPAVDIYGLGISLWECAAREEWGTPVMQQSRFERRVERRLTGLADGYAPLASVLRAMLQFEPEDRPSGDAVEAQLLAIADELAGAGLRTWSRKVVPKSMASRTVEAPDDDLTGRTFDVEADTPTDTTMTPIDVFEESPPEAPSVGPQPVETRWVSNSGRVGVEQARTGHSGSRASKPQSAGSLSPAASTDMPKRRKSRGGPPLWVVVALGGLGGLLIGVFLLLVLIVFAVAVNG